MIELTTTNDKLRDLLYEKREKERKSKSMPKKPDFMKKKKSTLQQKM
jgi:hypothetical protein